MLTLNGCLLEDCDGITLLDTTGPYSVDDPGGYGVENDVTDPEDFDSYSLRIWAPGLDPSEDDPTAIINLLDPAPIGPDDSGNYRWDISLEQLGLTSIAPGIWYAEAVGIKDGDIYEMPPLMQPFAKALWTELDKAMLKYDPVCGCKKGCADTLELYMMLNSVVPRDPCCQGSAFCSVEQTRTVLAEVASKLPLCC